MPDISLCAGRRGEDGRTPLRICGDCRRRTTAPADARQCFIEPPVRRVAGTTRFQCPMRLEPVGVLHER